MLSRTRRSDENLGGNLVCLQFHVFVSPCDMNMNSFHPCLVMWLSTTVPRTGKLTSQEHPSGYPLLQRIKSKCNLNWLSNHPSSCINCAPQEPETRLHLGQPEISWYINLSSKG